MKWNNQLAIDIDASVMEIQPEGEQGNKRARKNLQELIQEKLDMAQQNPFEEKTIFRLPDCYHKAHSALFEPKLASIGPYHHGKKSLRSIEEHKWSLLSDFLAREQNIGIEVYIQAMKTFEDKARRCYGESIDMDSDHFVMMLLLDGCFLLELFNRSTTNFGWVFVDILTDILLLENQLPFFIIHKLFCIQSRQIDDCKDSCKLLDLIFKCPGCSFYIATSASREPPKVSCRDTYHLLHFIHTCMVDHNNNERRYEPLGKLLSPPSQHSASMFVPRNASRKQHDSHKWDPEDESTTRKLSTSPVRIPCATLLNDAGVKFKEKRNPCNMFDITFTNGTLAIPFLSLNSGKKILYSNFVAFEQSPANNNISTTFTEYLTLMDALVNTEKDVILLHRSEILENMLPNDKDAATFFNDLGKLFVTQKYAGHELFVELRKYSNSSWRKQRVRLVRDYFNNPWSAISVVAAGVLLILTFLQTYYSMY